VVGTVARTAVVAGTATAVAGSVSRHGQEKANQAAQAQAAEAQQQQAQVAAAQPAPEPAPAAPGGLTDDAIQKLQQLAGLRDQGILTEEEFAAQKAVLLGM
jgi:hypothetical protein